jgi:hypothetical protein
MKPVFKHSVKAFKGVNRKEDLVYCSYNDGDLIISRKLPKRKEDANNRNFGIICKNLRELYSTISAEYKTDLASYTLMFHSVAYNPHKIPMSAFAIFTKMMWSLKKRFTEIDLSTLTRDDILKNEYPVCSVVQAMDAGLLLKIEEGVMLTSKI